MNNKIGAGTERLAYQPWQKSKEFEKYLAKLEVFMSVFQGKKIKGVLRKLAQFLEQELREVRMQSAIKQPREGLGIYTSFSMQGKSEI